MWKGCERTVFGLPELGFRWCLAFLHPLPTSFIFVFVQARLRLVFVHLLRAFYLSTCLFTCLLTFEKVQFSTVWKGCERTVFGLPELGFRWCLAFSHPLPMSFIESLQLWALSGIFLTTVLLSQPFLSVVARSMLAACYLMTQLVLGHVFPSGLLCVLFILPLALAD